MACLAWAAESCPRCSATIVDHWPPCCAPRSRSHSILHTLDRPAQNCLLPPWELEAAKRTSPPGVPGPRNVTSCPGSRYKPYDHCESCSMSLTSCEKKASWHEFPQSR